MQLIFSKLLGAKALEDVPQVEKPLPDPNCALVTANRAHCTRAGTWVRIHTIQLLCKGQSPPLPGRTKRHSNKHRDGEMDLKALYPPSLSNKKKNFKGTIFMSAKPDQMGPKKKADSPDSLPGLRFPGPVTETLSLIQGSIIAIHTHTHTHTHTERGHHKQLP